MLKRKSPLDMGLQPDRILVRDGWDIATLESGQLWGDVLVLIASISVAIVVLLSRGALKKMSYDQWSLGLHILLPPALAGLGLLLFADQGLSTEALPTGLRGRAATCRMYSGSLNTATCCCWRR